MKLLRKIRNFFKKYLLDFNFRNKVHLIPEILLIVYGLISSKYSVIFYGCLSIVFINVILNSIAKKVSIKEIKKQIESVSAQINKSDDDIINL